MKGTFGSNKNPIVSVSPLGVNVGLSSLAPRFPFLPVVLFRRVLFAASRKASPIRGMEQNLWRSLVPIQVCLVR